MSQANNSGQSKRPKAFHCYNCGQENDHFSKKCPKQQEWTRCPVCNNVTTTPSGHRIACSNISFKSTQLGLYELPQMDYHYIRLTFQNIEQIHCAEATSSGIQHFLMTKLFSIGPSIRFRRMYGDSSKIIIDMKFKPSVSLGLGLLNETSTMASLKLCHNHIRVNHFHHIDESGNVSFNLSNTSQKDATHDVELKLSSEKQLILFSLEWNKKWIAKVAMNNDMLTIR